VTPRVGRGTYVVAERVAGRDEGAAIRPEKPVSSGERSAWFIEHQGKRFSAVDPVVGLAVGLDEADVYR
jgi:hypothetical protein